MHWTLKRKFLLPDPSAGGAKVQTSSAGAGGDSVSFSATGEVSADLIGFIQAAYHGVQSEIYSTCLSYSYWDQAYSWWELWDPVQPFITRCLCRLQFKKGCTAEPWRPSTGVNPESSGLAVRLRTLKMVSGSLWGTPTALSLLKTPEKFSYLVLVWSRVSEHELNEKTKQEACSWEWLWLNLLILTTQGFGVYTFVHILQCKQSSDRQDALHERTESVHYAVLVDKNQQLKCAFREKKAAAHIS